MRHVFRAEGLSKYFGALPALDLIDLELTAGSIIGLIGPNGSGKSTLLHHMTGLTLPTDGACSTFGTPTGSLDADELTRIGFVQQHPAFVGWMHARQQLSYLATFYPTWDHEFEERLIEELDLRSELESKIANLSPGTLQKVALVAAVCHRPDLLLLDEPMSALDPIARETVFRTIIDECSARGATIVISSHILRDIERIVDHVICLRQGRVHADESLDTLRGRYACWWITSPTELPDRFAEPFIVDQRVNRRQARLVVRDVGDEEATFVTRHGI